MAEETFARQASILNDVTKDSLDLERCNNQVFVSKLNYLEPFSYTSLFSIKYVFYGVEKYRVNGVNNELKNGDCLIVNNESEVLSECGTGNKDEVNYGMSSFLTPSIIAEVLEATKVWRKDMLNANENYYKSFLFYDGVIKNNALTNYLKQQFIFFSTSAKANDLDESFYYQLSEHVLHFQHGIFKKLCGIDKIKYSTRQEILKRVLKAKEIIDANYYCNLDLNFLAKESCLSKYFLIKSFKQVFNVTPHQYQLRLKINKAKELLKHEKNYTVSEVAASLNYPDIYTFSKQFRNILQCSPTEFKRRA
ncbi:MAG TPA: AraC family transcriptional regulator [Parafilimonas sp.]|nr:AraC family transcriptional regulator [Parafilimonas sp.]